MTRCFRVVDLRVSIFIFSLSNVEGEPAFYKALRIFLRTFRDPLPYFFINYER